MLRRIFLAYLCMLSGIAVALPLDTYVNYVTAHPAEAKKGIFAEILARGTGTNDMYVLEVDPTTGALPVSGTFSFTPNVTDFGVTTNALRTASVIGNTSGQAAFGTGTRSAQTLRVTVATDDVVPASQSGTWNINNVSGTVSLPTGAATAANQSTEITALGHLTDNTQKTQIVNSTGSANTLKDVSVQVASGDIGIVTNSVIHGLSSAGGGAYVDVKVNPSGSLETNAAQSGTWTVQPGNTANTTPWLTTISQGGNSATVTASNALKVDGSAVTQPVSAASLPLPTGAATESTLSTLNGKVANDYGVSSGAVRTAAQVGNATGVADFGSGAAGSQTLRTVISTRSESVATPLAAQLSNGSAALDYNSGAASAATLRTVLSTRQESVATPLAAQLSNGTSAIDYGSGAAGTATLRIVPSTRSEAAATPLAVRISDGSSFISPGTSTGRSYSDSARLAYSSTNVTSGAWVQLIASTAATINQLKIFHSCGYGIELGTGGAGVEARKLLIPPGGFDSDVNLAIASSTRISLRALSTTCDTGEIILTGLN